MENFEVGSQTPPQRYKFAVKMFFILKGKGIAVCEGIPALLNEDFEVLSRIN